MTYYCPICGNILIIKKISTLKRMAICSATPLVCDLLPIEYTQKSKYGVEQSPGSLKDSEEIAITQQRFNNINQRWIRDDNATRSNL